MSDVADLSAPPQPDDHKRILFRLSHATAESLSVPASLLIQTLEGAQRVIWLLALADENLDIRMRARIPAEIKQRYQLTCSLPQAGSYTVPAVVVSEPPVLTGIDLTPQSWTGSKVSPVPSSTLTVTASSPSCQTAQSASVYSKISV